MDVDDDEQPASPAGEAQIGPRRDMAGMWKQNMFMSFHLDSTRDPLEFFTDHQHTLVDLCGHWILLWQQRRYPWSTILDSIVRLLPVAPHLAVFVDELIRLQTAPDLAEELRDRYWTAISATSDGLLPTDLSESSLHLVLLTVLRLLDFDNPAYAPAISPAKLQPLLRHESRPNRYLTISILCSYLHAADHFRQSMIDRYLGDEPIIGPWAKHNVDYIFLPLWEEKRIEGLRQALVSRRTSTTPSIEADEEEIRLLSRAEKLSPFTSEVGGCLLPRLNRSPRKPVTLVSSPTTETNLRALAQALLLPEPILVTGLAGSGKTSVITHLANELDTEETMLTLHLNEQTDAKLLIGMYTTASTPGSFAWQAGVLTTAVREGRWVLIEDLDRAPAEILSVILPLLERRELLIPSRGEVVRAARGFRLIATIRSGLNTRGEMSTPDLRMLGARLWRAVRVQTPGQPELSDIIHHRYPLLQALRPMLMRVYDRVQCLYQDPAFAAKSKASLGRPLTPRDLFKWCRRVERLLIGARSKTGFEPLPETVHDHVFLEAVDCFAGCLQTLDARTAVFRCIGEEMHIAPQKVDFILRAHTPKLSVTEKSTRIGRCHLPRVKASRTTRRATQASGARPFAMTGHTLRLLELVGVATQMSEPILLVGETGIGKTAVIQHLAELLGQTLTTVNLSQQSESGDLLGGFKPVDARSLAIPMKDDFDDLFDKTFSSRKNQRYLDMLNKSIARGQWSRALTLWKEALKMAEGLFGKTAMSAPSSPEAAAGEQPAKKRKLEATGRHDLQKRWDSFSDDVHGLDMQLSSGSKGFAFKFVEGNIIKAVRNGGWVLLDEINLASSDTLESIADLLQDGQGGTPPSVLLSETGEIERIHAHKEFRIFGAMNPATDVGKKDLPMGLRSRFTEVFVEGPDRELENLLPIIKAYLGLFNHDDERAAGDIAQLYLDVKRMADESRLVDGASQRPHYSLRTLTRTLTYVTDIAPTYGLRRALFEGFSMSFLTLLDQASEALVVPLIDRYLLGKHKNVRSLMRQVPRPPTDGKEYVQFEQYWMLKGGLAIETQPHYIITPFVRRNMLNLIRATSTRRFPVLIQGPTSSGKTSMIEYLAKITGNKFVRINNHEHTDLQEYLGTYVSGEDGRLLFREGVLVQALREGHWVVLDELNLAPTDVLEALNRLLDDNRELLIPETQAIVRPHANFMLFATQNPAGLYGGRKVLSRAFRNRFLELHFDDIPDDELETILRERTQIAPSFCGKIVAVYKELSRLRQSDRVFEQRNSFATLRDLFRWALRDADDREQLAVNGYMLLAERVRRPEDRLEVKQVIERILKVEIDEESLFSTASAHLPTSSDDGHPPSGIVWTSAMRRLYILVSSAIAHDEPVLLVGETGCGKTSVCQVLAEIHRKNLHIVNAHQNTETGDLIGAQRPVRNRAAVEGQLLQDLGSLTRDHLHRGAWEESALDSLLHAFDDLTSAELDQIPVELLRQIRLNRSKAQALFQWSDGALVQAMKTGQFFLLDEISLADDSVLERLNSVLEPQRNLLLAEKGPDDSYVEAGEGFQFLATMNPGGDYGKRELSPALRNRFTEIWVPPVTEVDDVLQIAASKLAPSRKELASIIVRFSQWFGNTFSLSSASSISIRDVLAWVSFINSCDSSDPAFAVVQGAAMVFIDTLGANPAAMLAITPDRIHEERIRCLNQLSTLFGKDVSQAYFQRVEVTRGDGVMKVGPFSIPSVTETTEDRSYNLEAPTTKSNAMRLVRALQVRKPILLEGSPGVGKTTLVAALARAAGKPLTRINLSEQTDLMDLFGSDIPMEGAEAGHFVWRDAAFLQAMQRGGWVLLDEMNLASQSVLEGLNACLDHRGEVYISELDQTFAQHPDFVVFAAQNPHHQGGGRKGLPSSFVNRFTVVYADVFDLEDLMLICTHQFPTYPKPDIERLLRFVSSLDEQVVRRRLFGTQGGPWEFNLRDMLRWLQLLTSEDGLLAGGTANDFLDIVFLQRFRASEDRVKAQSIFRECYHVDRPDRQLFHNLSSTSFQVGFGLLKRSTSLQPVTCPSFVQTPASLPIMESLMICIQQRWPAILVGPAGCGKSQMIRYLAAIAGAELVEFALNPDVDTMDLVGGYEQVDLRRQHVAFLDRLERFLKSRVLSDPAVDAAAPEVLRTLGLLQSRSNDEKVCTKMYDHLLGLSSRVQGPEWSELLRQCKEIGDQANAMDKARFEWVDGALIKALEAGKWLVLDNANLCSASVLDRLNSLLEPDGVLSIDEHRTLTGDAKVVTPHPNFRIFLTMDPKNGELSRAMRNRAVEIFMEPPAEATALSDSAAISTSGTISQLSRYRQLKILESNDVTASLFEATAHVGLSHLSYSDLDLIVRWKEEVDEGLLDLADRDGELLSSAAMDLAQLKEDNPESLSDRSRFFSRQSFDKGLDWTAQPNNPLNNQPLLVTLESSWDDGGFASGYAFSQEVYLEALHMRQIIRSVIERVMGGKLSGFTKLMKSIAAARTSVLPQGSTEKVFAFIASIHQALLDWACDGVTGHRKKQERLMRFVEDVILLWRSTIDVVDAQPFEEGVFQVHLQLWRSLLDSVKGIEGSVLSIALAILDGLAWFAPTWKLSTGLSMARLWLEFRPPTPSTEDHLKTVLEIEDLACRFDAIAWRSAAPLEETIALRGSIREALWTIRSRAADDSSLIRTFADIITDLEDKHDTTTPAMVPYFTLEFETLCQYYDILRWRFVGSPGDGPALDPYVSLLAQRPTGRARLREETIQGPSDLLSDLSDYVASDAGHPRHLAGLQGQFLPSVLQKIINIGDVPLRRLDLLFSEVHHLGQSVASSTEVIALDQLKTLSCCLSRLMRLVLLAHADLISGETADEIRRTLDDGALPESPESLSVSTLSKFTDGLPVDHHFREVSAKFFVPSLQQWEDVNQNMDQRLAAASRAWISFSIGALELFVPDRVFDPALEPFVECQLYKKRQEGLQTKLEALQRFEGHFTGQNTNIRIVAIQDQLNDLGSEPLPPSVVRPAISELGLLQGDFTNLLSSVVEPGRDVIRSESTLSHENGPSNPSELLRTNVCHIIRRLSSSNRMYDDLTKPVIGLLRCLDIGFTLAEMHNRQSQQPCDARLTICNETPFLGGQRHVMFGSLLNDSDPISDSLPESRKRFIAWITAVKSVEKDALQDTNVYRKLMAAFHAFYKEWKAQLEADQQSMAEKHGLYRYNAGEEETAESEAADFAELFPTFDSSDSESADAKMSKSGPTPKYLAADLADLHAQVFTGATSTAEKLLELMEDAASRLGALHKDDSASPSADRLSQRLLPTLMISLSQANAKLTANHPTLHLYNFYVDANLAEAKKLVLLVHRIQLRFGQLREAWPEHATLHDVLQTSDELLEFRHVEPVTKFLTKAEKLHGYMHEWQVVASKEYSAIGLYDDLTSLLVSWRRLELSTWARLFDIERVKCEQHAKSWWFTLYETSIAVPLSLVDEGKDTEQHAVELLSALKSFFDTTSMGQFSERLRMLDQFREQLSLLSSEMKPLNVVLRALTNFIDFYSRFRSIIEERLGKGRQALEKDMKEVVLLASWKDTNINALRESAKRSHHKLFKIVRKYRALLDQTIDVTIGQGLPDSVQTERMKSCSGRPIALDLDPRPLSVCRDALPTWGERPARFVNVKNTTEAMVRMSRVPESAIDGDEHLESLSANLVSNMENLRKQTPSTLTDDNKESVKHLKSRKRVLFADILKALRGMGFKHNLDANTLAQQDALSRVLARARPLAATADIDNLDSTKSYFFKVADLVSRARLALTEHSEDLTGAEVKRSVGYLEGILSALLQQQETLGASLEEVAKLDSVTGQLAAMWAPGRYTIVSEDKIQREDSQSLERVILWLPSILSVGDHIIGLHSTLGKVDASQLRQSLSAQKEVFASLVQDLNQMPSMPEDISTSLKRDWIGRASSAVDLLKSDLDCWIVEYPLVAFALRQIVPWTEQIWPDASSQVRANGRSVLEPVEFDATLTRTCDSILVTLQKMQESLLSLPSSTEDAGWLMRQETSLARSLKELCAPEISSLIQEAMETLAHVDISTPERATLVTAISAMVMPIVQRYRYIYREAVQRYVDYHRATAKLGYILAKSFTQIASQGFCTPAEKQSKDTSSDEKLEAGTGLGDGEGAEDISKDIQDDEDLSELAQEPDTKDDKGEVEDEKDAVDMADDMDGELGDASEKGGDEEGGSDDGSEKEDIDEETGSVDDLDPTAVDEKLWDGKGEEAEKEQEGDKSTRKPDKDEHVAADEKPKKDGEQQEQDEARDDIEDEMVDEEEGLGMQEAQKTDPQVQEAETLELPDEMDLDGDMQSDGGEDMDSDGMGDLSDVEPPEGEAEEGGEEVEGQEEDDPDDEAAELNKSDAQNEGEEEEEGEEGERTQDADPAADEEMEDVTPEEDENVLRDQDGEANTDAENAVASEVTGTGDGQEEDADKDEDPSASNAQRDEGSKGGTSSDQQKAAAEDGEMGDQTEPEHGTAKEGEQASQDTAQRQAFQKLGDALERWHQMQKKIQQATEKREGKEDEKNESGKEARDFEHLENEEAEADTQALGAATEEQAHALDESMAIDPESKEAPDDFYEEKEDEQTDEVDKDQNMEEQPTQLDKREEQEPQPQIGSKIGQSRRQDDRLQDDPMDEAESDHEDLEDASTHLSEIHLDPSTSSPSTMTPAEARTLWSHYETSTRSLSQTLTEQLRLILHPSVASKLRGDFRTGKRLNMKRIIPYIASSYKRDKIWLRRAVPHKRAYQILLAVDDSSSMAEHGAGARALETLVMVSRSLAMLEVGQVAVVAFGGSTRVAHAFTAPFSQDAGANLLRHFSFAQSRTDVKRLLQSTLELFREARLDPSASSSAAAELWQIQFVISDGLCEDREDVRRLVRQALDERIMVVFLVVDGNNPHTAATSVPGGGGGDGSEEGQKGKGKSITTMTSATFLPDGKGGFKIAMERYLDGFPFPFYIVVGDVRELPGVLAGALRQWVGEVEGRE